MELKSLPDNRSKIMAVALELAQTRGFNAFSYLDLAAEIGIKTSTIHYYFASKEVLGIALIQQYTHNIGHKLDQITVSQASNLEKFRSFVAIFEETAYSGSKICLGGMMGSDLVTLPDNLKGQVRSFFAFIESWLEQLLEEGRHKGEFNFEGRSQKLAALIVASLEGGLISARIFEEANRLKYIGECLEALFKA